MLQRTGHDSLKLNKQSPIHDGSVPAHCAGVLAAHAAGSALPLHCCADVPKAAPKHIVTSSRIPGMVILLF